MNEEDVNNLEQLLESLIKMVGRANQNAANLQNQLNQMNQNMDSLQMRICQLEWIMKAQLEGIELHPIRTYPNHPLTQTSSKVLSPIPFRI